MNELFISGVMGFLGGLTRGMVSMSKTLNAKQKIKWKYLWLTVLIATVIGAFMGILFHGDYKFSILAGYAGTDILEGAYKSFKFENIVLKQRS